MKEAFVNICNIPTSVVTCGGWIEETINSDEIVICITGNPGLPGFYTEFCKALYDKLEKKIPVWVIGHAGHEDPPESSLREVPQLVGNEAIFDLDGQINHKIEFIRRFVPAETKVHLIGHSIGAWIILQLLQNENIKQHIKKCYLLFPTIEHMMESPNGWLFTKLLLPLYSIFGFMINLFQRAPNYLKIWLIELYFWFTSIPKNFIDVVLKYVRPAVLEKVVFLAEDEMVRVRSLPTDILTENMHLLKLYYSTSDNWVPVKYFNDLKIRIPDIDAELDSNKIDHSFVLRHSEAMGAIVGDFIIQNSDIIGNKNVDDL